MRLGRYQSIGTLTRVAVGSGHEFQGRPRSEEVEALPRADGGDVEEAAGLNVFGFLQIGNVCCAPDLLPVNA